MRRLLIWIVPVFVLGSFGLADAARNTTFVKTPVCDLTGSKTTPYKRVVATTAAVLRSYNKKPDDIIPAPRSCPKTLLTATTGGTEVDAMMVGVTETPNLGDPDGTGTASIRLRQGQGRVCVTFTLKNIGQPTAAQGMRKIDVGLNFTF